MELDAFKTVSQAAAAQGYQQAKVEQSEPQVRRSTSRKSAPVNIDLPNVAVPVKTDHRPIRSAVKTNDDISNAINGQNVEDADAKMERNNETLDRAIEQINQKLADFKSECQFNVHKQTGLVSIKILNAETKELVREIPPIKRLDAIAKMWELAGLIVDEKR